MAMNTVDEFKSHGSSTINRVHVTARRTESAVTAEGNEFKFTTAGASVHGTAKRRVTTVNHLIDVIYDRLSWAIKI